jgi:tRNA pseudouridine32 synthase/23S rRNA pseudouridine746 synthase
MVSVIFSDDALIAVDKPAGMLAVPGRGEDKRDCVATRVQDVFDDALIVHRLDMATSGVMLMARGADAQRHLSIAFARRDVHKSYLAVVHGRLSETSGEIALPLIADWPNRPRQKVDPMHGKPSLTRYHVLSHDGLSNTSRVVLEPITGRSHQLRVHLSAIGHPIVGDPLYGSDDAPLAPRLLLHASELALPHPVSGQTLQLRSAPCF